MTYRFQRKIHFVDGLANVVLKCVCTIIACARIIEFLGYFLLYITLSKKHDKLYNTTIVPFIPQGGTEYRHAFAVVIQLRAWHRIGIFSFLEYC